MFGHVPMTDEQQATGRRWSRAEETYGSSSSHRTSSLYHIITFVHTPGQTFGSKLMSRSSHRAVPDCIGDR